MVEVDPDPGKVRILRYAAVDDVGRVINPMIVDGMVHGGIAQGVAQALHEFAAYDDGGQASGSMMDYALPKADDLPFYEMDRTVTPSPVNPMGVKGAGETGTIASTVAVANAVMDALAPLGITHIDMPLTPARIWAAVQAARRLGGSPMYPASFEYHRAGERRGGVGLLTRYKDDAKFLAGGHSLIPMMKLRLAQPKHLITSSGQRAEPASGRRAATSSSAA